VCSCGSDRWKVKDTRGNRRRRECLDCGTRRSTLEIMLPARPDYQHRAHHKGQQALPFTPTTQLAV
jgi:transcriptional regulator NrdR family protein